MEIQKAMESSVIRNIQDNTKIKQIYYRALMLAGIKNFNEDDIKAQVVLLTELLQKNYAGLRIGEIQYAAEQGAIGRYGQNFGINPANFCKWLDAYMQSEKRKRLVRHQREEIKKANETKALPPSTEEKQKFWNERKADYLESGNITGGLKAYEVGIELGIIDLKDKEAVETAKKRALKWVERQQDVLKGQHGLGARYALRPIREILTADPGERKNLTLWVSTCKRELVKLIFEG